MLKIIARHFLRSKPGLATPSPARVERASGDSARSGPVYRVLIRGPERAEPGGTVQRLEVIEVSEAQFRAYCDGSPSWRTANGLGDGFISRTWRRLFGGDA
jgi:hypothetical protein